MLPTEWVIIHLFFLAEKHVLITDMREFPILQQTLHLSGFPRNSSHQGDSELSTLLRFALWPGTSNPSTIAIYQGPTESSSEKLNRDHSTAQP